VAVIYFKILFARQSFQIDTVRISNNIPYLPNDCKLERIN